ncbi:MAG: beta-ketoacyl synthase chain length factor [Nitrospirae bacterium]|nr:beta-ketoacyl synthase chain length factor [Nitrospirota bacterium]
MNMLGMGIVFASGRGIDSLDRALHEGWQAPAEVEIKGRKSFAYKVDQQAISDRTLLKNMRRADKLSKMAVVAASEALAGGMVNISPSPHPSPTGGEGAKIGVIVATALGAHVTTFDFLDDILEYGDAGVSPTTFSNSVHNAAASYISSALGIEGPTLTVTQFFFAFHSALQLAQVWLNEGRCDYVLAGTVEQYGDVLAYVHDTKLVPAHDGRIKPFNLKPAFQVPGEGSVFFLLGNNPGNAFCEVQSVSVNDQADNLPPADLNIIDADGLLEDESIYKECLSPDVPAAAYSPLFGSMMSGSAFNCAAGALMLKNQKSYANPVTDNPYGFNIVNDTAPCSIELIRCVRYNCFHERAEIYLRGKQIGEGR